MAVCAVPFCEDPAHYACSLRAKAIAIASAAIPNRMQSKTPVLPRKADPAWERGLAGETRSDGSFMPYLNERTGSRIHVKEGGERRQEIKAIRDRQRNDPNVFAPSGTRTT